MDVSFVFFVDDALIFVGSRSRSHSAGIRESRCGYDTVSHFDRGEHILLVALTDVEVKIQFALAHLRLIHVVDRNGHSAAVVIADGGIIATHLFAFKHYGSRLQFAVGKFQGRGDGELGVFDKEFLGHTRSHCGWYVLADHFQRLRIAREILGFEVFHL